MNESDPSELVSFPHEERNLEFKRSMPWDDDRFKAKITRSILGMSNMRDGGWVIIGKEEQPDGTYNTVGMRESDFDSFDSDVVKDFVAEYADPYVDFAVHKIVLDQKRFVLIRVQGFDSIPVICKKDWDDILRRGTMYTRSRRKPETVEIPGQSEMREIIDVAVEKEIRNSYERLSRIGLPAPSGETDKELFDKQREDLL